MTRLFYILSVSILLIPVSLVGQVKYEKGWSVEPFYKAHKFYDEGVYEFSETNQAYARGFGLAVSHRFSKKLSLFGGYSFALLNDYPRENSVFYNNPFHQIDINLSLNTRRIWRLEPNIFSGYSFNAIQLSTPTKERIRGMGVNFGGGSKLYLSDNIALDYKFIYSFRLSNDDIPYNYSNRIGLSINTRLLKSIRIGSENVVNLANQNSDLNPNNDHSNKSDLLKQEHDQDSSIDSVKNAKLTALEQEISWLQEDNQRLLDELRSNRRLMDSLSINELNALQFVDDSGATLNINKSEFSSGYYILASDIAELNLAVKFIDESRPLIPGDHYILKSRTGYKVMLFSGTSSNIAIEQMSELQEESYDLRILLF